MGGDATDAAGSFDATPVNAPGYAGGQIGQAILLNGTNQRADVIGMGEYAQVSASLWINTSDADRPADYAIFHHNILYGSNPGTPHLRMTDWRAPAEDVATIAIDYGAGDAQAYDSIAQDEWHHVA